MLVVSRPSIGISGWRMNRNGQAFRGRPQAEIASRQRFMAAADWCRKHLPQEHPQLAASTCLTLRLSGTWPTPAQVQERLRAQGR